MPDPMPLPAGPHRTEIRPAASSGVAMLFVVVVVVATLYFAREILVPFALAALLSFVLAPLVRRLRRLRVPRVAAVLVAVVLAFAVILGAGAMLAGQVTSLATNLPQYQSNISAKIQSLRGASPGGVIERASSMLKDLGDEISKTDDATQPNGPLGRVDRQKPLPVEIRQPDPAPFQIVQNIIGPLLHPLATTGVVLVFVIFILLQREDLRDRLIRLAGARDLHRTTQALDDAGERVSRYLLMQLVINACFGLLIGIGLWVIGVPNPVLWGVTAMLLRFVPFIGAFIAAALPFALAVAVAPGWSMALWTLALFVVVEPVVSQVVEPLLYGTSTGLSSIAVVLSAIFWTWLWGPVGLLLSMPLTVCLVVLGRHVPQLHFLDVALGNRAVLAPEESFYQRLLAGDPDEASENVETFLKERPLSAYYDEVALRALGLAQSDLRRGALDDDRRQRIKDSLDGVFDNLSEHGDQAVDGNTSDAVAPMLMPERLAPEWQGQPVLCAAGKTVLDEGAAALLAQLLERHGLGARVAPCETVAASRLGQLDGAATRLVCLSYLDPDGQTHARFVVRRLRRRLPQARIVVGFWTVTEEEAARRDLLAATGADAVVYTLRQAVSTIIEAAQATVPHHAAAE